MGGPPTGTAAGFRRLDPAYRQVADQLRDEILRRGLGPGDRLPNQTELSTAFGVSRGTVREAIRLLASDQLVHSVRGAGGGIFVAEADPTAISANLTTGIERLRGSKDISRAELLEAREVLEVPAARLAAGRRTSRHLAAMAQAVDDERDVTERTPLFRAHLAFHSLVLEAAGNRLLAVMTAPVFHVIRAHFLQDGLTPPFWTAVADDHGEILRHVTDGDGEAAGEAMRAHLGRLRPAYTKSPTIRTAVPLAAPWRGD